MNSLRAVFLAIGFTVVKRQSDYIKCYSVRTYDWARWPDCHKSLPSKNLVTPFFHSFQHCRYFRLPQQLSEVALTKVFPLGLGDLFIVHRLPHLIVFILSYHYFISIPVMRMIKRNPVGEFLFNIFLANFTRYYVKPEFLTCDSTYYMYRMI